MPIYTETDRINRLILQGGRTGMTELQFFAAEIKEWKDSPRRKDQLTGDLYYIGKHDILKRQRTIIGEDGKLQVVDNLPNNRVVNNQYALMVDQKTNYLVGKPFTLNCENKGYVDLLSKVFNKRFQRLLKYVCEDALNGGLGWLYPYYDDKGRLAFKHYPAYDILPFWADDDHTILDCAMPENRQKVGDSPPWLPPRFSFPGQLRFYSPLYFFLVARPPRMCRWALLVSRMTLTCSYRA